MDLTSQVVEAIDAWLQSIATQLLGPALAAAGALVLQTPAFDAIPEIQQTWSLVRNAADALFVVVLMAAGVLVMARGTVESRYSAKLIVPRVALAAVGANASLAVCGGLIQLDNALVAGFLGPAPASTAVQQLAAMVTRGGTGEQAVGIVVGLAAAVLAILLVALYVARDLVLLLMTVVAPLALATYAFPQTDEIARLWWRAFSALLFVQVVQALLIGVGVELLRHADWLGPVSELTSGLVLLTLLYLLFKLPFAAYQWAFRHPIHQIPAVRPLVLAARSIASAA